jgi:hypothetical protein
MASAGWAFGVMPSSVAVSCSDMFSLFWFALSLYVRYSIFNQRPAPPFSFFGIKRADLLTKTKKENA